MSISIIVAVASNNVIGKNNTLIWQLPEDMKFFKEKTTGHPIITGRKNYESIPERFRPLANRTNIIITRQRNYDAPGTIIVGSVAEAIETAKKIDGGEIFIIGGGDIFKQSIPFVDTIYLTRIDQAFEGDVFFPELSSEDWKIVANEKGPRDENNPYDYFFMTYKRVK